MKTSSTTRRLARFYLQAERYEEAEPGSSRSLLKKFPDNAELKEQIAPSLHAIVQLAAERRIREWELRSRAGQQSSSPRH